MLAIRHVHERWMPYDRGAVSAALDELWTRSERDAFPHEHLRVWRYDVPGNAQVLAVGTLFGHGGFAFVVDRRDAHGFRARITTPGYEGWHGFELEDGSRDGVMGTRVTHELVANLSPSRWASWTALIGGLHDWAVRSILQRLEQMLASGVAGANLPPPWQLRALAGARRLRRNRHHSRAAA